MRRVAATTLVIAGMTCATLLAPAEAGAAPAAATDIRAARRATAESIAAQYAAEQFRAARIGDETTQRLLADNDAQRRRLAAVLKDARATAAQRDAALARLAELDAQLGELNKRLLESEQTGEELRAQLREYQRQITDAVESAGPEVLAAYELYARGDRDTAYEVIDRLSQIEAAAAKRAGEIRAGALLRRPAYLAMDRRDRGEMTLAQVISAWERAQAADGAYYRGWITLTGLYSSAGRLADARSAAERALGVASNDVERGLANAELGKFLADQGDRGGASAAWATALAQLRAAHAANPADDSATEGLILILTRLGEMHASLHNPADAAGFYEEALGLARAQAEAQPLNRARQRSLLVAVSKVGEAHQDAENWPAALKAYEIMEGLTRAALADVPGALVLEREHAIALLKLGDLRRQTGDPERARPLIDEGLAVLRRAAAADASSQEYKRDLAMGLVYRARLSALSTPRGQREYLELVEESVRLRRELVAADPGNVERQRELALGLEVQARAFTGRPDPSPARPLLEEALAIYQRIAVSETADGADMRPAAQTLETLAQVVQRTNPAEAGPMWDQALATERLLADTNPTVRVMQVDYAVGLAKAAQRRLDAGDTAGAIDLLQQTLVYLRKAVAVDGSNRATRRMLATTLKDLGDFLYHERRFDPATALYREALTEFRRLNKDRPDDAEALRDYWQALKVWADRTDDRFAWASVVRLMEDAEARGQLTAEDRRVLANARQQAARTAALPPPPAPQTPAGAKK